MFLLTIIGCTSVEKEDLQKLNGYWEIQKVTQPDGKEVEFDINTIYDYYEIGQDNIGFYKKVYPQLDGTFIVDTHREEIEVIEEDKNFKLKYYSDLGEREVHIVGLTFNKLILKNSDYKTYCYKRAEPINLLNDEK